MAKRKTNRNIFIIGLGGSGKSTVGKLLAISLNFKFIDLDTQFRETYGDIGKYITDFGSESYGVKNSKLFEVLLKKNNQKCVFALPPGFVVSKKGGKDMMTARHQKLLSENGISVLLLPSSNYDKCLGILIKRQLKRGLGYNKKEIIEDVSLRFPKFIQLGDIRIFSADKPRNIVKQIINKLNSINKKTKKL